MTYGNRGNSAKATLGKQNAMTEMKSHREGTVPQRSDALSASGGRMSINDLPPPDTTRWVPRRKAEVVSGVRTGIITLEDACRRYDLSIDEFRSWERLMERHGVKGLRTTQIKAYRAG